LSGRCSRSSPFNATFAPTLPPLCATAKTQMQVKGVLGRRLPEPPFLLNDLPKTEGDTTEKIEKEGQE